MWLRYDYAESFLFKPIGQALVELPVGNLAVRLEGKQLFEVVARDRLLYIGNRATAPIRRLELRRDRFIGQSALYVRGNF